MLALCEAYLELSGNLHANIHQAIDDLPAEALDWSPGPGINSLGILVAHVAGSERYWVGDVIGGAPSGRNRDAEFATHQVDAATLGARLDAALAHSRSVMERITLADLEAKRLSPRHEQEYGVSWILLHVLEHTGTHVGHIQVTRQLWDQRG